MKRKSVDVTLGDRAMVRGPGGELHQVAAEGGAVLTTNQGNPISDDQSSLRVGPSGPLLLDDFHYREKMFHFDHERIPERVVHARGSGAHGFFEAYDPLPELTRAHLFQERGRRTPVFVRFSTVAGSKGSPDLARDVRGFAVKFYTAEGNWDLVGNNIPVFFIQDPIKFPDLIHAAKPEPDRGFPQAQTAHDTFWDFVSLTPESTNMLLWIMSDRTLPRSFRFMEGFGVHTFRLIDANGKSTFAKFHWKPKLGVQSVEWNEAVKINGADPDFHRRDLWAAIQSGDLPEWELGLQVFDEAFAEAFAFDVLDCTKLIPEEALPVRIVGRMVLDRTVDNFFAETEQVAFCTQNVVPGIGFTDDPMLQGRNFSYLDTQLKRLGSPNFHELPINRPRGCPFQNFQQDGHMRMTVPTGRALYQPSSFGGPRESPERGYVHYPAEANGQRLQVRPESFADHYSQARQFYVSQTSIERDHIVDAFVFELSRVEIEAIRMRVVSHLVNVHDELARRVATGLGMADLPAAADAARPTRADLAASPALSILSKPPTTFAGRKVGALVSDGVDGALLTALSAAVKSEGAVLEIIAPTIAGVTTSEGTKVKADKKLEGGPSVLYDAVVVLVSAMGAAALASRPAARDFVADAFAHHKFIGYSADAVTLFDLAVVVPDPGFLAMSEPGDAERFVTGCRKLRFWGR